MASAIVSRRGFLGHCAGAYTTTGLLAGVSIAAYDPVLDLIQRWNAATDMAQNMRNDAEFSPFYDTVISPIEKQVNAGLPPATTAAGAIAAIEKVIWFGDLQEQDESLIRAALGYLESLAA